MRLFWIGLSLLMAAPALGQNWGRVEGHVREAGTEAVLPGVTVLVQGTNYGTATDGEGRYALQLPEGRYALRFSAIGFAPHTDSVAVARSAPARLDVLLTPSVTELEGVTVEGAERGAGVFSLDPEDLRRMPAPFHDGFRALKALPGVATNNELSYQYSVRGGGFNENLVFLNGFEVYFPFRPRQGEQEGLGLLNPELTERLTFYTGGFPARYGGKLSSALDVRYARPVRASLRGAAYASLLDAGLVAGASALDGRLGWTFGLRKAQAQRFFATQELKGTYQPDFADVQATLAYRLAPGHEVEALGIWADHRFRLDPSGRKTYFGILSTRPDVPSDLRSLWVRYDAASEEEDGYGTRFGGLRLSSRLSSRLRLEHDAAYFGTRETERYFLAGSAVLYQVNPSGDPDTGAGHIPTGNARQEETADNAVRVQTWTGQGRALFTTRRHAAEAGWMLRRLRFDDRLAEQSAVTGRTAAGDVVRLVVDSLTDQAALATTQAAFYLQDAFDALPDRPDRLVATAGLRADYFAFNGEWTLSPRLSARYRASDRLTLTSSAGVYYQAPTYRELRGRPRAGETILGALNRDARAQRALQVTAGGELFLPRRRLYLRGEAYYKHLTRLISYAIENVRVVYAGVNDTRGRAYGLDLQLRGEFVPGLESWFNYSYLVAQERFLPGFETAFNAGWRPRAADQRHTFSAYVQDYIPGDPSWKLHLRGLFGSGLPYTPPVPGPQVGGFTAQVPGPRHSGRYPEYMRLDFGVTKRIPLLDAGWSGHPVALELTGEVLNLFDMTNTVAYSWVPNAEGIWNRVPTRLTPRTLNVRLRVDF